MNFKQLFTDDRAVSPVIGVILMVAITVILAAVIGTFVLGLGSGLNQAPQAQLDFSYNSSAPSTADAGASGGVSITHQGGEALQGATIEISGAGASGGFNVSDSTSYTAGSTIAEGGYTAGETINVVWTSPDGGSSQIIGESTAPN